MENYIIDKNIVAIYKEGKKTIIVDVNKRRVINKNIRYVIDQNCMFYGSNLKGRKVFVKKILNKKYKLPILINNNIIFIQISPLRNEKCLYIMLDKIVNYSYSNKKLVIECLNNLEFSCNISLNSFKNLIVDGLIVNNVINFKNSTNFV